MTFDEIINDNDNFQKWGNLLNFQLNITSKSEFIQTNNNRYYVINEGLAYEIIDDNLFQLHFPDWLGNNFELYDIVIRLTWQKLYG